MRMQTRGGVIDTFHIFFSKLNPGGVYLIEDLHTSYWDSHEGGYLKDNTSIEFLKKFSDLLISITYEITNFTKLLLRKKNILLNGSNLLRFTIVWLLIRKLKKPREKTTTVLLWGNFSLLFL